MTTTIGYIMLRHTLESLISQKDSNRVIFIDYYVGYKCIRSGETTWCYSQAEDIVRILIEFNQKKS